MTIPHISADQLHTLVTPARAIEALTVRLRTDPPRVDRPSRSLIKTNVGELLVMPDESITAVGLKLVSIARGNPAVGLPSIQGIYLLMDADTLTPRAILDAAALTCIRTSAVSLMAIGQLNPPPRPDVTVIGSGPQALAHIRAASVLEPTTIGVVARNPVTYGQIQTQALAEGIHTVRAAMSDLSTSDIVICCTTAREPILYREQLGNDVIVVAIGSHEPSVRELSTDVMSDAFIVVESEQNARREAGDIIVAEAELGRSVIDTDLQQLVGGTAPTSGVRVFKSTGDAWEDLTIAEAALSALA